MRSLLLHLLALAATVTTAAATATAQQPPSPQAEHRWLQQFVGDWTVTSKASMEPGGEETTMQFEESVRAIGELWIQGETRATLAGAPFTALLTIGYDPQAKAFGGTWIDSTQTHMWHYRGQLDAARKVLTLQAEGPRMDDPGKMAQYRDVFTVHGPNHRSLTSAMLDQKGRWVPFQSADYHRKVVTETATLAAGCFWCIEAVLERVDGIVDVESGYMGGAIDNPTYKQICTGTTGHAEVVQVRFDPKTIAYAELLDLFFQLHDPTTLNRQGNDFGTQYRSAIFFHSAAQQQAADQALRRWQPKYDDPIVTEVTAASKFWSAEGYHQDYWANNPGDRYCTLLIPPKLKKLGLDQKGGKNKSGGKSK